jgi:hypothetical protein
MATRVQFFKSADGIRSIHRPSPSEPAFVRKNGTGKSAAYAEAAKKIVRAQTGQSLIIHAPLLANVFKQFYPSVSGVCGLTMTAEARLREIVFRAAEDFQIIRLQMTAVAQRGEFHLGRVTVLGVQRLIITARSAWPSYS